MTNQTGATAVSIYFADPGITELFAALLSAGGVPVNVLNDLSQAGQNAKIITEAQYFPRLTAEQARRALIVGRKSSLRNVSALCLAQPLTEEGVESALAQFLSL